MERSISDPSIEAAHLWEKVGRVLLRAPIMFRDKIKSWRSASSEKLIYGVIGDKSSGMPNAAAYQYGSIVNEASGMTFEIYPTILDELSKDRQVGIEAPEGHITTMLLVPFSNRDKEGRRLAKDAIRMATRFIRNSGDSIGINSVKTVFLPDIIQDYLRENPQPSNDEALSRALSEQISIGWANAQLTETNIAYNGSGGRELSPAARAIIADRRPIRVRSFDKIILHTLGIPKYS